MGGKYTPGPSNPNEDYARELKAAALARFALNIGLNPDALADRATDKEWNDLAMIAGVYPPGSTATKDRVVEIMRQHRQAMRSCDEMMKGETT